MWNCRSVNIEVWKIVLKLPISVQFFRFRYGQGFPLDNEGAFSRYFSSKPSNFVIPCKAGWGLRAKTDIGQKNLGRGRGGGSPERRNSIFSKKHSSNPSRCQEQILLSWVWPIITFRADPFGSLRKLPPFVEEMN